MAGYGEAVKCPICGKALNKISNKNSYYCWGCETEIRIFKGKLTAYKYTENGIANKILEKRIELPEKSEKSVKPKKGPKVVIQYEKDTMKEIRRFDSVLEASEKTGINKSGISHCCQNVYKQSGGFIWRFADA